jgi:hypothetical protein
MAKEGNKHGPLAFFGMNTVESACETFSCLLPIVAIMVVALGVLSYLFNRSGLVNLSVGNFSVAIAIAVVISFFTLARLRVMNLYRDEGDDDEDGDDSD